MMEKLKHKMRIVWYILLLIATLSVFLYLRSRICLIFMTLLLVLPVCSFLAAKRQAVSVSVRLHAIAGEVVVNEMAPFVLKLENPDWLPVLKIELQMGISNAFMDVRGERKIILGIAAQGNAKLELPLRLEYVGVVQLHVTSVRVWDLFGIFSFPVTVEGTAGQAQVAVFPIQKRESSDVISAFRAGYSESEESSMRGNDFSEVHDLREYVPGDRLKDIHWKASAKRQELMVKDRVSLSQSQLILIPELVEERKSRQRVMERMWSLCLGLLERETSVLLVWGEQNGSCYGTAVAGSQEEMRTGFEQLFLHACAVSGKSVFEQYHKRHLMAQSCLIVTPDEGEEYLKVLEM